MAVVGRIARPHGLRGQVIVNPETDFPHDRFVPGAALFVSRAGIVQAVTIASVRFQQERPVIGLQGVADVNDAQAFAGAELRIPADQLMPLPKGVFYQHQLMGCAVVTQDGGAVGTVREIDGSTGALRLVVDSTAGEVLIPLAAEICIAIDPMARRIVITPPEGLLTLNAVDPRGPRGERRRHRRSSDRRRGSAGRGGQRGAS